MAIRLNRAPKESLVALCWAHSPEVVYDFTVSIGFISVDGPWYRDGACTLGADCALTLEGSGLLPSDTVYLAPLCEDNATAYASAYDQRGAKRVLSAHELPLRAPSSTLSLSLCWIRETVSGATPVTIGVVELLGPHSFAQESVPQPCAFLPICIRGARHEPCAFNLDITGRGLQDTNRILFVDAALGCGAAVSADMNMFV